MEDPEVNASTLASVARLERGATRVSAELGYVNLVVHCDAAAAASLSTLPDVVSIQPYVEPIKGCERQAMIVSGHVSGNAPSGPGYLAWLASKGFTQAQFDASAFGVDVSDSGIDNGSTTPNHFGLYVGGDVANASRVAYNRLEGTANLGSTLQACDGHGNLNAHIVGGYASLGDAVHADASGYRYGLGIAPYVKVGSSVDRFGNLATGWVGNVSLGIAVNPTSTALAGTTTETAVAGVATFADVSLPVAGTWYRLSASAELLGGDVSSPFHVRPGAVAGLVFATQPGGSVAGEAVAGRPSVHLVDAFGNRQPDAAATVTVALADNPGADSLGGTVAVDAVAGAATFTQLVLDAAADGYTLVASAGGFAVESAGFDVHAAAPAALEFVAAPAATAALAPLTPAPAVRVRDAFGNTVAGPPAAVTLTLGSNPSSGKLSGKTAVATVSGLAAFHGLSVDKAGSAYTLSASADGLPPTVSDAFDVTVAPAPPPVEGDGDAGCGCSGGGSGELGLMLGLAALGRAAITPRRRRAA